MKKGTNKDKTLSPYWCRPGYEADINQVAIGPTKTVYYRGERLSSRDRGDLEAYAAVLRPYYNIPEGEPVFPELETTNDRSVKPAGGATDTSASSKRATGRNDDHHPWRGSL